MHKKNIIDPQDISVVVQGAIDKNLTPQCLKSIRKHLPGAEIILSTWDGSDVSGLDYDKLVLNKDPGGFYDKKALTLLNNLNRQLFSTKNGLNNVNRRYAIKLRSDLQLVSANFLTFINKYPSRDKKYSLFESKLLALSFFSKKFLQSSDGKIQPTPYHVSDWCLFGTTKDMKNFYNIDLAPKDDFYYFNEHDNLYENKIDLMGCSHRYAPEQYLCWSALKAKAKYTFDNYMDYNRYNIEESDRLIANNFVILQPNQFGVICLKKATGKDTYKRWCKHITTVPKNLWDVLYRYDVFEQDYIKYCCGGLGHISWRAKLYRMFHSFFHKK